MTTVCTFNSHDLLVDNNVDYITAATVTAPVFLTDSSDSYLPTP